MKNVCMKGLVAIYWPMQAHGAYLENEPCFKCYIKTIFINIIKDRRQSKGFVSLGTRKKWK